MERGVPVVGNVTKTKPSFLGAFLNGHVPPAKTINPKNLGILFHSFLKMYAITIRWKLDLILLNPPDHTSSIRAVGAHFATSP
jgi:hypothetical protein